MDSLGEILHLCRLCLVKDHVNIPIFDDPGNIRQISLKISSCLPVKISRNDNLPKKICDGCSEKLDLCYEFWNSSAIAEKKLLSMVAEKKNQIVEPPVPQPILMKAELVPMDNITSEQVAEEENQSEPLVPQPIVVKQEAEVLDTFESSVERTEETEAPPSKRPRRSAAIKAQKNIVPESDDDDDDDDEGAATEDINSEEPLTKEEPYVDEDIHTEVPGMSVDDAQPGTSGLNQGMEDSTLNNPHLFPIESSIGIKEKPVHKLTLFSCTTCQMKFCETQEVEWHLHQDICRYFCHRCGLQFDTIRRIVDHVIQHNVNEKPECKCEICNLKFGNLDELEQHRQCCHEFTINRGITELDKKNVYSSSGHSDTEGNEVGKELCRMTDFKNDFNTLLLEDDLSATQYSNRGCHLPVHTDEKRHKCEECGKCFSKKDSLKKHLQVHTGKKPFQCNECSKLFSQKQGLEKHLRIHTGERPYKCNLCEKGFTQENTLVAHVRTHTGEKPYKCNYCQKCFSLKRTLNDHVLLHTGEKPFKCNDCGKSFRQKIL